MLGLGFPQLVLILAGICFMVAGVYGIAPSLVTSLFSGRGATPVPVTHGTQMTKKEQKAQRAREHAERAKAEAAAKAERQRVEARAKADREQAEAAAKAQREEARMAAEVEREAGLQAENERAEAERQIEQARVDAEMKKLEAEKIRAEAQVALEHQRPASVTTAARTPAAEKPARRQTLEPAATFKPAAGSVRLSDIVAPVADPFAPVEAQIMDPELVDELFAEMFALRSTVADLVGEVHQMRSEQKPRRFVIEEIRS